MRQNETEEKFRNLCLNRGLNIEKSKKLQDISEHWDFKVNDSLVDVKGLKRVSRSDKSFSYDLTWVEFTNVLGKKGWLQCCADYIAFESTDCFIIVSRKDLLEYCYRNVQQTVVNKSQDALYKMYSRRGRKDVISLISLKHLAKNIKTWKLKF